MIVEAHAVLFLSPFSRGCFHAFTVNELQRNYTSRLFKKPENFVSGVFITKSISYLISCITFNFHDVLYSSRSWDIMKHYNFKNRASYL